MGDEVTLDDGRVLSRSSMSISGFLHFTAEYLPEGHERLRRWLVDVADRPNGLASIDLRGLTEEDRRAFHDGARRAYEDTIGRGQPIGQTSWALSALKAFIEMQDSIRRGDPPQALTDGPVDDSPVRMENLDQIWSD